MKLFYNWKYKFFLASHTTCRDGNPARRPSPSPSTIPTTWRILSPFPFLKFMQSPEILIKNKKNSRLYFNIINQTLSQNWIGFFIFWILLSNFGILFLLATLRPNLIDKSSPPTPSQHVRYNKIWIGIPLIQHVSH